MNIPEPINSPSPITLPLLLAMLAGMEEAHSIGDFVYQVRECEAGELPADVDSWEGPRVKAWSDGAAAIQRAIKFGVHGEGPCPGIDVSSLIRRAVFRTEGGPNTRPDAFFAVPDSPEAVEVFARILRGSPEDARTEVDFAIEFAEYLAGRAAEFLAACNRREEARARCAAGDIDREEADARDAEYSEAFRMLAEAIFEFRKRAARVPKWTPNGRAQRYPVAVIGGAANDDKGAQA